MPSKIVKPALAVKLEDWNNLDFTKHEYLATPKIDGIRALKVNSRLVSKSFKLIRNRYIREILEQVLPEGADGEIIDDSEKFQTTSSVVMSEDGRPEFTFKMFDWVQDDINEPYAKRILAMQAKAKEWRTNALFTKYVDLLIPLPITNLEELKEYEEDCLTEGYEGVILRIASGPYKCGRSTLREQYILKIKRFIDDEAIIIGFGEKMHNENKAQKDAFGRTKRSSAQAGKVAAGTLGYLIVRDVKTKKEFEVGTGFNNALRQKIWDNRGEFKGQMIVYKHFAQSGVLDLPRFPVFKGFRHPDDMGE